MSFLNRLFRSKTEYVYGTAGKTPKPARRHSSGRVEFVLWKAGEQGHAKDYWAAFHEHWWHTFKEDPMTKNAELIRNLRQVCLRTKGKSMDEVLQDFIGTMEEAADALEAQAREIEGLRKDAERLDWLESSNEPHGFCHTQYGEYRFYAQQAKGYKTVRQVIDAAKGAPHG